MKNKIAIIPILLLVLISACDKKSKKQYSNWNVNGENFSTNDVEATIGKAVTALDAKDLKNRFNLVFNIGFELPTSGTFDLNTFAPGQQLCGLGFYFHGKFYYHTPNKVGKLYASEVDGKARYTLPPSWFVYYDSIATDSVLISAELNEP